MGLTGWAVVTGMVIGAGVAIVIGAFLPPAAPDLRAALARLDTAATPGEGTLLRGDGGEPDRGRRARWATRFGTWVAARTPTVGPFAAPTADLRLLGITPVSFAAGRAAAAAGALTVPAALWTLTGMAGLRLPVVIPAVTAAGLAAAATVLPAAMLRQRATRARSALRVALSAYLDLVALERVSAGSPVEALEAAAQVGHGPAFTLLRARLLLAARSGTSPYLALADLAEEIGVAELRDLADIAAIAADGAAVYTTLLAKSRSLRNAIGADAQAAANAASERLVFPVVLLGTAFLLLVFYPALARLLTAG